MSYSRTLGGSGRNRVKGNFEVVKLARETTSSSQTQRSYKILGDDCVLCGEYQIVNPTQSGFQMIESSS